MTAETQILPDKGPDARRALVVAIRSFHTESLALWPRVFSARSYCVPGLTEAVCRLKRSMHTWATAVGQNPQGPLNHWEPVVDESTVDAGILRMRAGNRYPLHDHPNALSVTLVVSGTVITSEFQRPDGSGTGRTVRLPAVGKRLLGAGKSSLMLPSHGNAHDLSALTDSTLLEITVSRHPRRSRFWYFPLRRRAGSDSHLTAIAVKQRISIGY